MLPILLLKDILTMKMVLEPLCVSFNAEGENGEIDYIVYFSFNFFPFNKRKVTQKGFVETIFIVGTHNKSVVIDVDYSSYDEFVLNLTNSVTTTLESFSIDLFNKIDYTEWVTDICQSRKLKELLEDNFHVNPTIMSVH